MKLLEMWSDEYFIDKIERQFKYEISMFFHVHYDRHPTKQEYQDYFAKWQSKIICNLTDYDLGIFND